MRRRAVSVYQLCKREGSGFVVRRQAAAGAFAGRRRPGLARPHYDRASVVLEGYERMKPSISLSAKSIAALIDLPDCVHWAIILGTVAWANI